MCQLRILGEFNASQVPALLESNVINTDHTGGNSDTLKGTLTEGLSANVGQAFRQNQVCQAFAIDKRSGINAHQGRIRSEGHSLQALTYAERSCLNSRHTGGNINRRQIATPCERGFSKNGQLRVFGDGAVAQTPTVLKGRDSDFGHACGNHYVLQATGCKRVLSDGQHAFGNDHTGDSRISTKGVVTDCGHGIPIRTYGRDEDIGVGAGADTCHIAGTVTVGDELQTLGILGLRYAATDTIAVLVVLVSQSRQNLLIDRSIYDICGRQNAYVAVLGTSGILDLGIKGIVQYAVRPTHFLICGTALGDNTRRTDDMDEPGLGICGFRFIHNGHDNGGILIIYVRKLRYRAGIHTVVTDDTVTGINALLKTRRILSTAEFTPLVGSFCFHILAVLTETVLVVNLSVLGCPIGNIMTESLLDHVVAGTDGIIDTGCGFLVVGAAGRLVRLFANRAFLNVLLIIVRPAKRVTVRLAVFKGLTALGLIGQTAHAGVVISGLFLAGSFCTQIVRGSYLLVIVMGCNIHMLGTADAGMVVDIILVIHDPFARVGSMTQCPQIVMAADETVACRDTGSLTTRVQALGALVDSRTAFTVTAEVVLRISRVYAVGIQIPPVAQRFSGLVNMILRLRIVAASTTEIILGRLRTGCFTCHIIITDDQLIKHVRLFIQTRRANLAEVVVVCGIGIDPLIAASMPQSFTYVKGLIRIMPAFAGFVILGRGGTGCLPCIVFRTDNLLCILMSSLALVIDHITD